MKHCLIDKRIRAAWLAGMIEAGHGIEKIVPADALKMVYEDRLFISANKTIIFD